MKRLRDWVESGDPWIWLTAGAVSISMFMVFGVLLLISFNGLSYFWPSPVNEYQYQKGDGQVIRLIGEVHDSEQLPVNRLQDADFDLPDSVEEVNRYLLKIGNRDEYGSDFALALEPFILDQRLAQDVLVVERKEWGNFYGFLHQVKQDGQVIAEGEGAWQELSVRLERARELGSQIRELEKDDIGAVNYAMERLRLRQRKLELDQETDQAPYSAIEQERKALDGQYQALLQNLEKLNKGLNRDSFSAQIQNGKIVELPLSKVVHIYRPNNMNLWDKCIFYLSKVWEFISDEPREANTEGGIFPAIFGTVLMVIIMAIIVTPFGVMAAVYLREYAKQGPLVRTIRIAVNNLAGVPSIVYGVFGLGFFVYFIGANIDQLFYPEALPAPTFGTPGILWASLTLAILTLPVVIVSTEEGLSRIPRSVREGSLALGATKAETLWRTVLPMASPAMMTGLILAVARAAGEVAPLMLVGVVKLAPSLAADGNYPFLHLDRKFMHLGFHIYDVGFQSPNVEAARPLVYATALLLVLVIVLLNLAAIAIRNHLREKYRALEV